MSGVYIKVDRDQDVHRSLKKLEGLVSVTTINKEVLMPVAERVKEVIRRMAPSRRIFNAPGLRRRVIRGLKTGGSTEIGDRMRSLKMRIRAFIVRHRRPNQPEVAIRSNAPHSWWVEHGIPHPRFARNGKVMRFRDRDGNWVFRKKVGPMKAQPFFDNTINNEQSQMLDHMAGLLRRLLNRVDQS